MAMAILCAKLRNRHIDTVESNIDIQLQAFVVDHRIREGSSEEARAVSDELRKLGE